MQVMVQESVMMGVSQALKKLLLFRLLSVLRSVGMSFFSFWYNCRHVFNGLFMNYQYKIYYGFLFFF
jgi:hypothetical protein